MNKNAFSLFLKETQQKTQSKLLELLESNDASCATQSSLDILMRYSFEGGKGFRPLLVRIGFWINELCDQFSTTLKEAHHPMTRDPKDLCATWVRVAGAVECVHAYSLVHDDLPAMDNATHRRGRLSVHKKFGEAQAILAGDALLTFAFEILASPLNKLEEGPAIRLVCALAEASGYRGMIAGQWIEIERERDEKRSVDSSFDTALTRAQEESVVAQLKEISRLKTGALLRFSLMSGLIFSGHFSTKAYAPIQGCLEVYIENLGLLYQIVDDEEDAPAIYTQEKKGGQLASGYQNNKEHGNWFVILGRERALFYKEQCELEARAALDALCREFPVGSFEELQALLLALIHHVTGKK